MSNPDLHRGKKSSESYQKHRENVQLHLWSEMSMELEIAGLQDPEEGFSLFYWMKERALYYLQSSEVGFFQSRNFDLSVVLNLFEEVLCLQSHIFLEVLPGFPVV